MSAFRSSLTRAGARPRTGLAARHPLPAVTPVDARAAAPLDDAAWRVLLVGGHAELQAALVYRLALERYGLGTAWTGADALTCLRQERYDLVVLCATLPDVPELGGLRGLRSLVGARSPLAVVALLTGASDAAVEQRARVSALGAGADDVVTWTDSLDELMLRVRNLRRRGADSSHVAAEVLEGGPLRVDVGRREATVAGECLPLTRTEFVLLHALMQHRERLLTRAAIASLLADGATPVPSDRAVDGHVARLRAKLGPMRDVVRTVPGEGYRVVLGRQVRATARSRGG